MTRVRKNSDLGATIGAEQKDALLRNVMYCAGTAIIVFGSDFTLEYGNRAFHDMLGYAEGEFNGRSVADLLPAEDREAIFERLEALRKGSEDHFAVEQRCLRKDESVFWVIGSVALLRTDGAEDRFVVQISDIDKQKNAEAELVATENRWNFALEAARQGVWDFTRKTNRMFYSKHWRAIRGVPEDEAVDDRRTAWLARLHPDDRDRIDSTSDRQGLGEDGFDTIEYREMHRDGYYIWIQSRGKPIEWDEDGNVLRTVGTDTDITEIKNAYAEIAESRERLRVTLSSIGDGVISTDAKGNVTFMNPAAQVMTAWQEADAIGCPIDAVFKIQVEATGEPIENPVGSILRNEHVVRRNDDAMLISKSGQQRAISETARPVKTREGDVIGSVLVFQDVTQSRDLQRQLSYSATHDTLTGLANRRAFEQKLEAAGEQARRENREHALCFIDLDGFKAVNDTSGHAAGDALLREVATQISANCRSQDFLARFGGDEFTLLLTDCSQKAAERIAAQITASVAAMNFTWEGRVHKIGASIGVATITHNHKSKSGPLSEADAACYVAKANGRGRVELFSADTAKTKSPRKRA